MVSISSNRMVRRAAGSAWLALNVLCAALPVLRSQRSGRVLQMSSIFGEMSFPATGMLAAVKQALGGATRRWAPSSLRLASSSPRLNRAGSVLRKFLAKWVVAEHSIADYNQTAGATLRGLTDLPPEAVAEVSCIAAAILEVVEAEQRPMRLALGGWAQGIIRKEMVDRSADLDNWSHLTTSVDNS